MLRESGACWALIFINAVKLPKTLVITKSTEIHRDLTYSKDYYVSSAGLKLLPKLLEKLNISTYLSIKKQPPPPHVQFPTVIIQNATAWNNKDAVCLHSIFLFQTIQIVSPLVSHYSYQQSSMSSAGGKDNYLHYIGGVTEALEKHSGSHSMEIAILDLLHETLTVKHFAI